MRLPKSAHSTSRPEHPASHFVEQASMCARLEDDLVWRLFQQWTRQNIELARQMFERAIELDPHFAAAWAGLATAHVYLFSWGGSDPDLQKAHDASIRALELDPELADAHVAAGQSFSMEQRYIEASAAFERAIELDPTLFEACYYYARSCFKAGDLEKA